jgi:FkbM family methyltransferase
VAHLVTMAAHILTAYRKYRNLAEESRNRCREKVQLNRGGRTLVHLPYTINAHCGQHFHSPRRVRYTSSSESTTSDKIIPEDVLTSVTFNDLRCRVYLSAEKLKVPRILRRIPGMRGRFRRLVSLLLPTTPKWVQVQSGISEGLWMRLNLRRESRLWLGEHEPTLQSALLAVIVPGAVVYDIGAHAGSIALGVSKLVGPSGRVVAFEADPDTAKNLVENSERNGLVPPLEVVSSAVWCYSSSSIVFRRGGERRSHGGVEMDGHRPVIGGGHAIGVPAVTLDDFISKGGPIPHLVKIDVEGGEFEVLAGGEHLFSINRPLVVAEVHHQEAADRIKEWLIKHQYSSRWITPVEKFPCSLFAWHQSWGKDTPWMSFGDGH